jgi:hypothetical protein
MRFAILAVLALLFAGCTSTAPTDDAVVAEVDPKPFGFELVCPPGETVQDPVGNCVGRLSDSFTSLQEPYVALDPNRPGVVVIGVNAGHTTGAPRIEGRPGLDMVRLDLYVSEDGGASWRTVVLPYVDDAAVQGVLPVDDQTVVGDPALVFDEHGVLYVSGIASHTRTKGYNVFVTSTPDLGATWSPVVVLTEDSDNDRNWISIGPDGTVFVSWQNVGRSSVVAFSRDGATWELSELAADCITVSRVAFLPDGTPVLACAGSGRDGPTGLVVYTMDGASLTEIARLPELECYWPQITTPSPNRIVMSAEYCDGGAKLAASGDGGVSWEVLGIVRDVTGISGSRVLWHEADPWGAVHLIIGGADVTHVSFDPLTLAVDSTTRLRAASSLVPGTVAPAYGDHFYGLAFDASGGFMAWTRDRGIDYAGLQPVWDLQSAVDG